MNVCASQKGEPHSVLALLTHHVRNQPPPLPPPPKRGAQWRRQGGVDGRQQGEKDWPCLQLKTYVLYTTFGI